MRLERAYFRKGRGVKVVERGDPIFFYVSGSGLGCMEVRLVVRCTCSVLTSAEEALIRFSRQGVVDEAKLRKMAGRKGRVHVVTFDSVRELISPASYTDLKSNGVINGANMVTTQRVDETQMTTIMRLAGMLRD